MQQERVHFYSDGIRLAGVAYYDTAPRPRAGIVVCHGFGGLKEGTPPNIARHLASLGYFCLSFDYRCFGESGGVPGRLIPLEQVADIRNALTYLETRPEVQADRLGLYGTSFGGGNVSYVAAHDDRVRCTVATVSVTNGPAWQRSLRPYWQWVALQQRCAEDRRRRVLTGQGEHVDRYELMVPDPKTKAFYAPILAANPQQVVPLTLETFEALETWRPIDHAGAIRTPILWISAEADVLVPPEQTHQIYERCGSPTKALVRLEGADHFSVYVGETFQVTMRHAGEWFQAHLPVA